MEGPGLAGGKNAKAAVPHPLSKDVLGFEEDDDDDDLEVFSKDASFTDASSFSISMQTSPSSMINQHTLDDEPDSKDIFVTVDDPANHVTTLETFVTYRIITKTTRSEFDSCEYEVRRRYQDFLWLKDKLEEAHATLIVPDLASHKKLGPGFISKMGETVKAVANTVRSIKNRPDEFTAKSDYVDVFRQKMGTLDKISQRILKELKEHLTEMKEYGPIYTVWSESEQDLAEPLKGVASSIENCCKAIEGLTIGLSEDLLPALHEYVLCAETLKSVLKRRDLIQADYESQVDALTNKKADREMLEHSDLSFTIGAFLGKNAEEMKLQKQQKIDREIEELQADIGHLEDKVECANSDLKADWERWSINMRNDLQSAFRNAAENNILYFERCLATWESFLASQQIETKVDKNVKESA
ncbi:sorting nexin-7 isoform X3 [Chiloscyllium punctatum]|uniref:sorting nexin-7 isoform X3 n=1 Tax=Chiloscyllium punctatum TaxID=137246 RepID=UPI003B638A62